jgi:hypothetical protein
MHLLDPRAGVLPVALCVFISGTILFSWIQAARQSAPLDKPDDEEPPHSKSA